MSALPSVSHILQKHWRVMKSDPYLKKVFPEPPMVAFRRTDNLRKKLIKAKVPPPPPKRKKREINGMKKCNHPRCESCPFILQGKDVQSPFCATSVKINASLDCNSKNVVYGIFCDKSNCKQCYIGETQRKLKERLSEHKNSVRKNEKNVIGVHFNGPGHSVENLKITAIEKVFARGQQIILKRESLWINNFEAEYKGLNRKQ